MQWHIAIHLCLLIDYTVTLGEGLPKLFKEFDSMGNLVAMATKRNNTKSVKK
jgi:hypothetical protein